MTEIRFSDRFDDVLMAQIAANLARFKARKHDRTGRKHAAVAFTLIDCAEPAEIGNLPHDGTCAERAGYLLTTRTSKLRHHSSQRAFPGGRLDDGETVEEAALRELEEAKKDVPLAEAAEKARPEDAGDEKEKREAAGREKKKREPGEPEELESMPEEHEGHLINLRV